MRRERRALFVCLIAAAAVLLAPGAGALGGSSGSGGPTAEEVLRQMAGAREGNIAPGPEATEGEGDAGAAPAPSDGPSIPEGRTDPRTMLRSFREAYAAYAEGPPTPRETQRLLTFAPEQAGDVGDQARLRGLVRLGEIMTAAAARSGMNLRSSFLRNVPDPAMERDDAYYIVDQRGGELALPLDRDAVGGWRFSADAIDNARERHADLYADKYWLRQAYKRVGLDALVSQGVLGLRYYQWSTLFAAIFIALVLDFVVRFVVVLVARRYIKQENDAASPGDSKDLLRRSAKPFGLLAAGLFLYLFLPAIELPLRADAILRTAVLLFTMFAGQWALFKVVDLAAEWFHRRALRTATRVDDLLIPLVRKSLKVFLLAFGLVFIAESLNLPITSLVAGLGIAGAAIAFASKDTIENLFGSVAVILDRPFGVGDWIQLGDTEGIVEELGFRSTRVRTFYNSLVTIPNATLVRATVDNYGRRRFRRFKTVLSVTYDTPADRVEAFTEGIREIIRRSAFTRKDFYEIHMNDFGAHSLDILVYMFFKVPDWSTELRERHRFCLDILRLAHALEVEFAFPTQTIHMAGETPIPPESPRARSGAASPAGAGNGEAAASAGGAAGETATASAVEAKPVRRPEGESREAGRAAARFILGGPADA